MVAKLRIVLAALCLAPSGVWAADRVSQAEEVQRPSPPEETKHPPKKRKHARKLAKKDPTPTPTPELPPSDVPTPTAEKPPENVPAPPLDKSDFLPSRCPDVK